jgi:hypothetical protein
MAADTHLVGKTGEIGTNHGVAPRSATRESLRSKQS